MIEILKFKAGNASNSKAIAQFSNAEIQDFKHFYLIHDLCRGLCYLFALFLMVMGILCFIRPIPIQHFFDLFAATKKAHFIEQTIRLMVGLSLIHFATVMNYTGLFQLFGWLIVITSLLLILLPWQWHHQFAIRVIPKVKRHLKIYGLLSMLLSVLILSGSFPYK